MRYSICVEGVSRRAATLESALVEMVELMRIDPVDVREQVEARGTARAVTGSKAGSLIDNRWLDADCPLARSRTRAIELYGEGGGLEVDEGAIVSEGDDGFQNEEIADELGVELT